MACLKKYNIFTSISYPCDTIYFKMITINRSYIPKSHTQLILLWNSWNTDTNHWITLILSLKWNWNLYLKTCFIQGAMHFSYILYVSIEFSGGFIAATCPHGIVYGFKSLLRGESVRDHLDLVKSFCVQPTIIINDMAGMTAAHGNKRFSKMFYPHQGRLADDSLLEDVKAKTFVKEMPTILGQVEMPRSECGHPVSGLCETFVLSDEFHKKNSSNEKDLLRDPSLVPQLKKHLNTQTGEQLFSLTKSYIYFLNCMSPRRYMFVLRLLLHLRNEGINATNLTMLKANLLPGTYLSRAVDGRVKVIVGTEPDPVCEPAIGSKGKRKNILFHTFLGDKLVYVTLTLGLKSKPCKPFLSECLPTILLSLKRIWVDFDWVFQNKDIYWASQKLPNEPLWNSL